MSRPFAHVIFLGLALAGPAGAAADTGDTEDTAFGADTRALLELQRSNRAAAPARPLSGPAAERVYQRYLGGFEHPVPDLYRSPERGFTDSP